MVIQNASLSQTNPATTPRNETSVPVMRIQHTLLGTFLVVMVRRVVVKRGCLNIFSPALAQDAAAARSFGHQPANAANFHPPAPYLALNESADVTLVLPRNLLKKTHDTGNSAMIEAAPIIVMIMMLSTINNTAEVLGTTKTNCELLTTLQVKNVALL